MNEVSKHLLLCSAFNISKFQPTKWLYSFDKSCSNTKMFQISYSLYQATFSENFRYLNLSDIATYVVDY